MLRPYCEIKIVNLSEFKRKECRVILTGFLSTTGTTTHTKGVHLKMHSRGKRKSKQFMMVLSVNTCKRSTAETKLGVSAEKTHLNY